MASKKKVTTIMIVAVKMGFNFCPLFSFLLHFYSFFSLHLCPNQIVLLLSSLPVKMKRKVKCKHQKKAKFLFLMKSRNLFLRLIYSEKKTWFTWFIRLRSANHFVQPSESISYDNRVIMTLKNPTLFTRPFHLMIASLTFIEPFLLAILFMHFAGRKTKKLHKKNNIKKCFLSHFLTRLCNFFFCSL